MPSKDTIPSSRAIAQMTQRIAELEQALVQAHAKHQELEKYRQLFLHMQHEVHFWQLVYNPDNTIKSWRLLDINDAGLRGWGKTRAEVLGQLADDIFHTDATAQFYPIVSKIFSDKQPYAWESYFAATDQYLGMTSIPFDNYFISIGVDISEVKRTEIEHRDTILKLREAIAAGNIGLWDWDIKTNESFYSTEWKAQLGYLDDEIENVFEEWRNRVHPDDLPRVQDEIRRTLSTKRDTHEVEFRMRHKDGSYHWIMAHASLLLNEEGNPIRMVGSHIDITKQKRMEETVLQHQKMQALGTLAGGIAHDFNNLLTPMLGYTHLLKACLADNQKPMRYVEQIELSALRAKDLVQQILFVGRTPTNPVAQIEPVYLSQVVTEVATLLKTTTHQNIKVNVQNETSIPAIGANASQIHRIILNLCNNAIQAMPDGGELSIKLYQSQANLAQHDTTSVTDCVCLSIADTGVGISDAMQKRIFEPFYTTKDIGEERGTGLGLAIVSTVMRQHGGRITVKSALGHGSSFTLIFPIIPTGFTPKAETEALDKSLAIHSILFIDDESPLCELGTIILSELGYNVQAFQQAGKALQHLIENPNKYQLIITDYGMPDMSGVEFIQQVKQLGFNIPTLVITGFTNMVNEDQQSQWGCDGIISKPYKINELKSAIARIGHNAKK